MMTKKNRQWTIYTLLMYIILYLFFKYVSDIPTNPITVLLSGILPPIVSFCLIKTPYKSKMYLKRLYFYLFLGIFFVIYFYIIIFHLDISDADSVRYALSALIQSEAAIIALVITLTLVAVQYAASSYSSRVIDVFKNNNPDFIILLVLYISAMIFGLFTLIKIDSNDLDTIKPYVYLTFSYSLFVLICLIPYIMFTLELLKPSKIIEILADDINYESLESYKQKQENDISKGDSKNPIQPVFDVIIKSLKNYDHPTVKVGVSKIVDNILSIYKIPHDKTQKPASLQRFVIHDSFINYFNPLIDISIKNDDELIIPFIIRRLGIILSSTIENEDFDSTNEVVLNLERIGKMIIAKKYFNSIFALSIVVSHLLPKSQNNQINNEKVNQLLNDLNKAIKWEN